MLKNVGVSLSRHGYKTGDILLVQVSSQETQTNKDNVVVSGDMTYHMENEVLTKHKH